MNKQKQKRDRSQHLAIVLFVGIQVLWAFRTFIAMLPNGFLVVVIGLPLLSGQYWIWEKLRHRRYMGQRVIGKYVRFDGGRWSYWVQLDRDDWVEDFEISFPVYKVLKEGDVYQGPKPDKYATRLLNRQVVSGLTDRATFERNLVVSLQEAQDDGYPPLRMEICWTEKTPFKKVPGYIFYVSEWE